MYVPIIPDTQLPINEIKNDFFHVNFRKYFITNNSITIVPIIKNQKCQKVEYTHKAGQTMLIKKGFNFLGVNYQ
jgi:hypothetical protein